MFSGFPLFSQSIEKFLKPIIFLETGQRVLIGITRMRSSRSFSRLPITASINTTPFLRSCTAISSNATLTMRIRVMAWCPECKQGRSREVPVRVHIAEAPAQQNRGAPLPRWAECPLLACVWDGLICRRRLHAYLVGWSHLSDSDNEGTTSLPMLFVTWVGFTLCLSGYCRADG